MPSPEWIANQSPDAQHANSGGGSVNQIRIDVGQKVTMLLLALSVMVNLACFWNLFTLERETRLKEYDLKSFQSEEFAPWKSEVSELQREMDAVRMQLILRQELRK